MNDVNASSVVHADQVTEAKTSNTSNNQGTLKAQGGKEHTVYPFSDTESVSEGVEEFLTKANDHETPDSLLDRSFTVITQETIDTEHEIAQLQEDLKATKEETPNDSRTKEGQKNNQKPLSQQGQASEMPQSSPKVYSSLFSLAQSFNKSLSEGRVQQERAKQPNDETQLKQPIAAFAKADPFKNELHMGDTRNEQHEKDQDEEQKEGFGGQQQEQQQQKQPQKQKPKMNVKASASVSSPRASHNASAPAHSSGGGSSANQSISSTGDIFFRFMTLMARILGQAEAEAHSLYLRIKERTDSIDHLTLFISKLNSQNGAIDWSNDEEMKKIVDRAREIGVDIPEGKYTWTEDEKKLLKENIQMRKDSMEKVTQLERTDMQRFLQESSQCHQARSNVLKLLKEVMDTIIHNMRP